MRRNIGLRVLSCLVLMAGSGMFSAAQTVIASRDVHESAQVPSRIVKAIDNAHLVKLGGNTHPLAQPRFDQGPLEPSLQLDRMMLVLSRSPEQEQQLEAFSARQYDPKSSDFHNWLHASEFGSLYGPSDADITAIENWLQGLGFTINEVAKGRTWIQFSGNVSMVQNAFHVEMHKYLVNGETHIANDRDPQIPEALSPVVTGIASLHNFFPKPQMVRGKLVKRDRATGRITPFEPDSSPNTGLHADGNPLRTGVGTGTSTGGATPELTYTDANSHIHEDLTPYDFATIYNYLPLWNASKTGTGVTVAIAAGSDIDVADLTNFRKTFGLAATTLNVIHNGTDPGESGANGDQGENTLDVEMVSASAPGATIDLVVSANTNTTAGFQLSDAFITDNETAPIMSASYGSCELELGTANNAAFNNIWQQGATEGISIFESSGDQGSAGCTRTDGLTPPQADQIGLQVNGMASSPYVTAVGGTDFTWSFSDDSVSTYWNQTNSSNYATAKGYLPEVPWNSTCSNPLLLNIFSGETSTEQLCNGALNSSNFPGLVNVVAGSGGYSHCTTPSGTTGATCSGGYAKPTWQTGLGVPADGKRDLPDVSLFASDGFPDGLNASAILFCESSSSPEGTCDYTNPSYVIYQEIGGTSASSPLLAGIMALIEQKTGSAQGLANPMFYQLAASQVAAGTNCDSSTDTNASTCIFHDISQGTISQVCVTGDPNCVTNTAGDEVGLLSGYAATKGYDEAIGLGSVNVNNLVNSWTSTTGTSAVTLSPTSATFPSTAVGSTSAAQVFTLKNSGTVAVTISKIQITGTNSTSYIGGTSCSTTTALAAGASCTVTVSFKPAATGTLTATVDVTDSVGTQTISLTGTGTSTTTTLSLTPTTLIFASTTVGSTTAAQMVTIKNTGTATATLTSETITGTNTTSFLVSANTCGSSLAAAASCTVSVEFAPAAAGSLTASLSIADNATGSPQIVSLSGTGTAAATTLSLSPTSLTFPSTTVGSTSVAQVVTVKNTSAAAVTISKIQITGTNSTSYTGGSSCSTTTALAVGASCTVTVYLKPVATGTLTAAVTLTENVGTQTIGLSGTGVAASAGLSLSPTSLTFASTVVGATTNEQTVTLTNTGSTAVTVTAIALGGTNPTSFQELTNCGTTLAASASCAFYIALKPAATGSLTATLSITDSAPGSPQTVALSGTGTAAPTLSLSATSIAFATTKSGTASAAQTLTLTNSGTTTINIGSISLAGSSPASFQELTNCGPTLAANSSCSVYVAFKPTATGSVTATLSIVDNAASSPQSVALSGTGD